MFSQKGVVTFGIQYKPILPIEFLNVRTLEIKQDSILTSISNKLGHSFGMVIRWGFTKSLSLETGINYIRRNYKMVNQNTNQNFTESSSFGMVSYEIPIQGLIYVRLNKNSYLNVSTGLSFNWIASAVTSVSPSKDFSQFTQKRGWLYASYLANVGYEYRTKESGYFYFGVSLHNPLSYIAKTRITYYNKLNTAFKTPYGELQGNFFTIDLRYFFNEAPVKRKK